VVWTTPKSSCAIVTDPTVKFPVKRKGLDDVLGIGFAQMEKKPQAVSLSPRRKSAKLPGRPENSRGPSSPGSIGKKGQTLTHTFYYSISKPDPAFHVKVWAGPFGKGVKTHRYSFSPAKLEKTAGLFTHCLKESHFLEGKGFFPPP